MELTDAKFEEGVCILLYCAADNGSSAFSFEELLLMWLGVTVSVELPEIDRGLTCDDTCALSYVLRLETHSKI